MSVSDDFKFYNFGFANLDISFPLNESKEIINAIQDAPCKFNAFSVCKEGLNDIHKIHELLVSGKDLSVDEKLEYCSKQRAYMKKYLREIKKK